MGHPTCIIEGLACWLTLCILEKIICNSTNSVQISFIETLKLIVFSWTIWWCYWQNVLMINEKNNFLTVSWLSGLLSAEIFISTGEWGVQMPPLTSENSYFLRSGPQGATLVMVYWSQGCRGYFGVSNVLLVNHQRMWRFTPKSTNGGRDILSGEWFYISNVSRWLERITITKTFNMSCGVPPSDLSRNVDIKHRGMLTWISDSSRISWQK